MRGFFLYLLLFLLLGANPSFAQSTHRLLRKGDQAYQNDQYGLAEENYRKALEKKAGPQGDYNLGNSIYLQDRFEEAAREYEKAAANLDDPTARADAFHNLGNTFYQMEAYDKALDAYKNALRLRPNHAQTQYNLAQALRKIKLQQQQNQQQQPSEQQPEQQPSDEQNNQQQENQPGEQPDQQNPQSQTQQPSSENPTENQQPQTPQGISEEQADRILDAIEREDQRVREKVQKRNAQPSPSGKDW